MSETSSKFSDVLLALSEEIEPELDKLYELLATGEYNNLPLYELPIKIKLTEPVLNLLNTLGKALSAINQEGITEQESFEKFISEIVEGTILEAISSSLEKTLDSNDAHQAVASITQQAEEKPEEEVEDDSGMLEGIYRGP